MSTVYNPEAEVIAAIERLELEAREIRRRIDHARTPNDRKVLNRQLQEIKEDVNRLQARLK